MDDMDRRHELGDKQEKIIWQISKTRDDATISNLWHQWFALQQEKKQIDEKTDRKRR